MTEPTIFTYYYGVICVYCGKFIFLSDYQTVHPLGLVDVTLNIPIRCPHCGDGCTYLSDRVVFSKSKAEMVPLDRDIR
jgi:hypothetical protein